MPVLQWFATNLLVPLTVNLYASMIIVRYIEFSSMRAQAREIVNRTRSNFFLYSYHGRDEFPKVVPKSPDQPDPLFHFAGLVGVVAKLRERGHKSAASALDRMEWVLIAELRERIKKGKYTDEDWNNHLMNEILEQEPFPDIRPSIPALFTILRWNV